MIPSPDGTTWYSTGIVLTWQPIAQRHNDKTWPGWHASCTYEDAGWVGDDNADTGRISTEGTLHTRYAVKDGDKRSGETVKTTAVRSWWETTGAPHFTTEPGSWLGGVIPKMPQLIGPYDIEVPARPTTDAEFAALPVLDLADFHAQESK